MNINNLNNNASGPLPQQRPPQKHNSAPLLTIVIIAVLIIAFTTGVVYLLATKLPHPSKRNEADPKSPWEKISSGMTENNRFTTTHTKTQQNAPTNTESENTANTEKQTKASIAKKSDSGKSTPSKAEKTESETVPETNPFPNTTFANPKEYIPSDTDIKKNPVVAAMKRGITPEAHASLHYFLNSNDLDKAINYFYEIALKAEFSSSNHNLLRWDNPVRVKILGTPTGEDIAEMKRIINELNAIDVLPPISLVDDDYNFSVAFCRETEMGKYVDSYVEGNWGFVSILWDAGGSIEKAEAAIATDQLNQTERNHIMREEFIQGFGMLNDVYAYPDSIFQQDWTTTNYFSPLDWAVIRIVYSPAIDSSMSRSEIREALHKYYLK